MGKYAVHPVSGGDAHPHWDLLRARLQQGKATLHAALDVARVLDALLRQTEENISPVKTEGSEGGVMATLIQLEQMEVATYTAIDAAHSLKMQQLDLQESFSSLTNEARVGGGSRLSSGSSPEAQADDDTITTLNQLHETELSLHNIINMAVSSSDHIVSLSNQLHMRTTSDATVGDIRYRLEKLDTMSEQAHQRATSFEVDESAAKEAALRKLKEKAIAAEADVFRAEVEATRVEHEREEAARLYAVAATKKRAAMDKAQADKLAQVEAEARAAAAAWTKAEAAEAEAAAARLYAAAEAADEVRSKAEAEGKAKAIVEAAAAKAISEAKAAEEAKAKAQAEEAVAAAHAEMEVNIAKVEAETAAKAKTDMHAVEYVKAKEAAAELKAQRIAKIAAEEAEAVRLLAERQAAWVEEQAAKRAVEAIAEAKAARVAGEAEAVRVKAEEIDKHAAAAAVAAELQAAEDAEIARVLEEWVEKELEAAAAKAIQEAEHTRLRDDGKGGASADWWLATAQPLRAPVVSFGMPQSPKHHMGSPRKSPPSSSPRRSPRKKSRLYSCQTICHRCSRAQSHAARRLVGCESYARPPCQSIAYYRHSKGPLERVTARRRLHVRDWGSPRGRRMATAASLCSSCWSR
jgi:hypothetical protein